MENSLTIALARQSAMRRFFTAFALTLLVASRLVVSSAAAESQPQGPVLLRTKVVVEGPVLHLGAMGDVIRVMNTKTSKIISASVTDSGAVEVIPGRLSAAE